MDSTALGKLRNKFLEEAKGLEDQLKERRDKIRAIDLVLGMLIEEGTDKTGDKSLGGDDTRFRQMGPTEAIRKCINEPIRWWSITEIKKTLLEGGFKTKSKNLSNIITSTMKRFVTVTGEVEIDKTVKPQRFRVKEKTIGMQDNVPQDKPTLYRDKKGVMP